MANWAKLQEDLTGLKVVKRAKYGIHFDKGGGQILANFSGKPCHFLDGKIWKPIDTKLLLLPDGFYGCPHSPVKVSKDGRVKVDKSDYSQFTELPSAKTGVLDGDKIVREFPGGRQYLIITENGFKEEIHVEKPTFPLEKFIAKTSGALPSKYKESPLTAVDANENSYTFTGNVTEFGKWLDAAVYPVTIDPDFSGTSEGGDMYVNAAVPKRCYGGSNPSLSINGGHAFLRFILSSIASDSVINSATQKVYKTNKVDTTRPRSTTIYQVSTANGDWIEGTTTNATAKEGEPCWNAKEADGSGGVKTAWAGSAGASTAGTDYVNTALADTVNMDRIDAVGTEYVFTFNADGKAVLESWFGNATNNGIIILANVASSMVFGSSENATEGYRPVLSVTYTAGGVPKQYLHYARLRG